MCNTFQSRMLSTKETVSVMLFCNTICCLLNGCLFGRVLSYPADYRQLAFGAASMGSAYISFLVAASTWFCNSNFKKPRQHLRYVIICLLLISACANCITCIVYINQYRPSGTIQSMIELNEIFSLQENAYMIISEILCALSVVLLILSACYITLTALRKYKVAKQRKKRRRRFGSQHAFRMVN